MKEAMALMQIGDLHAATETIQRALRGGTGRPHDAEPAVSPTGTDCIEGQYRVVPGDTDEDVAKKALGSTDRCASNESDGEFVDRRFTCEAGTMHYKLFVPGGLEVSRRPLLVMLHGCTQSPDDFARGTRMNTLARQHGYVVAYPAQSQSRNPSKCWNWFRSQDQQRGRGECAILAALTREVVTMHGLDERRVYVAGLSAGGAMAAVLASTYPDVYAAFGVHSGLPVGAAHDLASAFAAMKKSRGATPTRSPSPSGRPVPAIVFHGDQDTTVDPRNGAAIVAQCMDTTAPVSGADGDAVRSSSERGSVPGGHSYTRTIFRDAVGDLVAEQWLVHGAGHAWSGGDRAGSYTDPAGPDASSHMLRFFGACTRTGAG